jgi:phosphate transport system substrate-binding protein
VIVIHRADGSGTTSILTAYLNKVSHEWSSKAGQGLSVRWPVGLGADGSKGVLDLVKQSRGTIGYAELNYARENGLSVAALQNRAGMFVEPTPQSTTASVAAFEADLTRDGRSPIVDPPASARDAYPVAGITYFLLGRDQANEQNQRATMDFVAYTLSNGQEMSERLSYAKLPPFLRQQANASLAKLLANGQPLN